MWGLGRDIGVNVIANVIAAGIVAVIGVFFLYLLGFFPGQDEITFGGLIATAIAIGCVWVGAFSLTAQNIPPSRLLLGYDLTVLGSFLALGAFVVLSIRSWTIAPALAPLLITAIVFMLLLVASGIALRIWSKRRIAVEQKKAATRRKRTEVAEAMKRQRSPARVPHVSRTPPRVASAQRGIQRPRRLSRP